MAYTRRSRAERRQANNEMVECRGPCITNNTLGSLEGSPEKVRVQAHGTGLHGHRENAGRTDTRQATTETKLGKLEKGRLEVAA